MEFYSQSSVNWDCLGAVHIWRPIFLPIFWPTYLPMSDFVLVYSTFKTKGTVLYWDLILMLRLRRPDNFKSDFVYTSIFIQKSRPFCLILNKNSTLDLLFCRKTDVLKNMRRNWVSISKAKYFSLIKEGLWIFFR